MHKTPDEIERIRGQLGDLLARVDSSQVDIVLNELLRWNPQLGLVSKQDTAAVVARLVRRSMQMWDVIASELSPRKARRIVDIGSGAGFPGLVWGLLSPSLDVHLVERKARKAHYLERLVLRLGLGNMHVVADDVGSLARNPDWEGQADVVAMMWVAGTPGLARTAHALLSAGGLLCSTGTLEPHAAFAARFRLRRRVDADGAFFGVYDRVP